MEGQTEDQGQDGDFGVEYSDRGEKLVGRGTIGQAGSVDKALRHAIDIFTHVEKGRLTRL